MKNIFIFLVLFFIFFIYFLTLGHSALPSGDSGELVATAYYGGIAHPPGYPLYNLIGHLFLKLPLPGEPAFRLNLLSAIFQIAALYIFYKICRLVTENDFWLSIAGTLLLASSYSFWLYAITAEVFGLHDLFFCVLLLLLFKIAFCRKKEKITRFALIWSFIFGLAMSNNHLIVLIFPAFVYVLWRQNKQFQIFQNLISKIKISLRLILFFLFGLLPYFYFFWATNNINPASWFYPTAAGDAVRHFLRLGYGQFANYHDYSFVAISLWGVVSNLLAFNAALFSEFWLIAYILPLSILYTLLNLKKKICRIFLILIFSHAFLLLVLKFGINVFTFSVLERLFITFYIVLVLSFVIFLKFVLNSVKNDFYQKIELIILFFLVCWNVFLNYPRVDQSKNTTCRDYRNDMVRMLPKNSIVLMGGDIETFCFFYQQYVLQKDDKRIIFIANNSFREKNNGKFLKEFYDFSLNGIKDHEELIQKYKNRRQVYYTFMFDFPKVSSYPLGAWRKVRSKNEKITNKQIYEDNRKWFFESEFLKNYKTDYAILANRSIKEGYCMNWLKLADYFLKNKEKRLAKKSFLDMAKFCQLDDFISTENKNYYQKVQSQTPI